MALQKDIATRIAALGLPKGFSVCELGAQGLCADVKDQPTKPWYESIGCGRYESIDGNGRGTITGDLNLPWRIGGQCKFDLPTFDMTKVGGYIVFDRPTTDYPKHCFYLINECLIRDLAAANKYDVVWFSRKVMTRGVLLRGILRRTTGDPFKVPQQGKYHPDLVIPR
jgi:hypothetical protein